MDTPTETAPDDTGLAGQLLPLALARPEHALSQALAVLAADPPPLVASLAHQAAGIVLRDSGHVDESLEHFAAGLAAARRVRDRAREADVLASFGVALVEAGRTGAGLRRLGRAHDLAQGPAAGAVLVRRAHVLLLLGRPREALADLDAAVTPLRRAGERLWEARCLINRSWAHGVLGRLERCADDIQAAEAIFVELGQHHEAAIAVENRAALAFDRGNLPLALTLAEQAEQRFAAIGRRQPEIDILRCEILVAAGLAPEALAHGHRALADAAITRADRAEVQFVTGTAALACAEPAVALALLRQARGAFARQRRDRWTARTDLLLAQVRLSIDGAQSRLLPRLTALAERLAADASPEAALARLLAGRLALDLHRPDVAREHLDAAARARHTGSALARASGWFAAALRYAADADIRAMRHACRRGLDALDEFRATFGDTELRALSTGHGRELAALALGSALDSGRARDLLWWSERWRATALTAAPVRPPPDSELAAALAAARQAARRLADPGADSTTVERAARERTRHEAGVRRRYRQLTGSADATGLLDVATLVDAVGADALVSLVDVRDTLYAVLVHHGRVTRHSVGSTSNALRESEFARFALRRAAYGRPADLARVGARLEGALLGGLADRLPEVVVVVPPAALHAAPWGLLPSLGMRRLTVAPSARLWLRSRQRHRPLPRRPALVTGPGLTSEAAEATAVAARYADSTVLLGETATVADTVRALDGAPLAHLAAHGSFRADAPLFSALTLADGPLYFHDLDAMTRPPHTLVLSACDAGDTAAVGADEGLGLVTALLALGTCAVLASVVPVNDAATIPVMTALHDGLAAGEALPEAMRRARLACRDDPAASTAAASFTPWGC